MGVRQGLVLRLSTGLTGGLQMEVVLGVRVRLKQRTQMGRGVASPRQLRREPRGREALSADHRLDAGHSLRRPERGDPVRGQNPPWEVETETQRTQLFVSSVLQLRAEHQDQTNTAAVSEHPWTAPPPTTTADVSSAGSRPVHYVCEPTPSSWLTLSALAKIPR